MATGLTYAEQDELTRSMPPPDQLKPTPVYPTDEEKFLLRGYDRGQTMTDLRMWHTFSPEDRIKRCERFAAMRGKELDPDRKVAADMRKRYLTFILMREINHPDGKRAVAEVAFDALFPTKKKG
jgi:hypothetical protein